MRNERLCTLALFIAMLVFGEPNATDGKKVVIHVPYKIKNIKHTHTIYKVIPHKTEAKEEFIGGEEFDHFKK